MDAKAMDTKDRKLVEVFVEGSGNIIGKNFGKVEDATPTGTTVADVFATATTIPPSQIPATARPCSHGKWTKKLVSTR